MPNRYYLAPCPYLQSHYEILDRHAVNGYGEPWLQTFFRTCVTHGPS